MWRPAQLPSEILNEICEKQNIGPPLISGNQIQIGNQTFEDSTSISIGKQSFETCNK